MEKVISFQIEGNVMTRKGLYSWHFCSVCIIKQIMGICVQYLGNQNKRVEKNQFLSDSGLKKEFVI